MAYCFVFVVYVTLYVHNGFTIMWPGGYSVCPEYNKEDASSIPEMLFCLQYESELFLF